MKLLSIIMFAPILAFSADLAKDTKPVISQDDQKVLTKLAFKRVGLREQLIAAQKQAASNVLDEKPILTSLALIEDIQKQLQDTGQSASATLAEIGRSSGVPASCSVVLSAKDADVWEWNCPPAGK